MTDPSLRRKTAAQLMAMMVAHQPDARFDGKRDQRGATMTKGWQNVADRAPEDLAAYEHLDWFAVQPASIGVFVVDFDELLPGANDTARAATLDDAREVARQLSPGGFAYIYQSTVGKPKYHIVFADPQRHGGRGWQTGPRAGFSSQGGLLFKLADGSLAKCDTRGGGKYDDGTHVGCHVSVDARRARELLRAAAWAEEGALAAVENPQALAAAVARKTDHKYKSGETKAAWMSFGLTEEGLHDWILDETRLIVKNPGTEDDRRDALDALRTLARRHPHAVRRRDDSALDSEIDRAYAGAEKKWGHQRAALVEEAAKSKVERLNKRFMVALVAGKRWFIDKHAWAVENTVLPPYMTGEAFEVAARSFAATALEYARHPETRVVHSPQFTAKGEKHRRGRLPIVLAAPAPLTTTSAGAATCPKMLDEYVLDVVCAGDESLRDWLLMFIAEMVQRAGYTGPGTAVVLTGTPGSGKSTIYKRVVLPVLGERLCYFVSNLEKITRGGFNGQLAGKVCVFFDDVVYAWDKKAAAQFKPWITEPMREYEAKYQPAVNMRNVNRLLFTTNQVATGQIEAGDRRYCVIETKYQFEAHERAKQLELFRPYYEWFDAPANVEEMRTYFHAAPVDLERLQETPDTDAKKRVVYGTDHVLFLLTSLARAGRLPYDKRGEGRIATADLFELLKEQTDGKPGGITDRLVKREIERKVPGLFKDMPNCGANRTQGLQFLVTPAQLAERLNSKLPAEERVLNAADKWEPANGFYAG